MKINIDIEVKEEDLVEQLKQRIVEDLFRHLTMPPGNSWDEGYKAKELKLKEDILKKINWSEAHKVLGSAVVEKFFLELLSKK